MAHQALYRVYRPGSFAEVVGQARSVAVLRAAVRQERWTHAYCFSGPRGTGKTSVARVLAKAVNCEKRSDGEPCRQCASCQAMERGAHLDVIEIDAASNRGIDEIRDIKERVAHLPVMGRMKVYIIDEVHMLTNDAFNALLKTLEEPPPHVMFILATTEAHKVPVTVLSRCQRYQFERLTTEAIAGQLARVLEAEGEAYQVEALELIADYAEGALRDALSLTDQVLAMAEGGEGITESAVQGLLGGLDRVLLERLMLALVEPDVGRLMEVIQQSWAEGRDVRQMLRDVARSLRDVVLYRSLGPSSVPGYLRTLCERMNGKLSPAIGPADWFRALEALTLAEGQLKGGFSPRLIAEMTLFKVQAEMTRSVAIQSRAEGDGKDAAPMQDFVDPGDGPAKPLPMATPAPPSRGDPRGSNRFQRVLDEIRRERPATHALLLYAEVVERKERVIIWFQFPPHRDHFLNGAHRDVLEAAFRRVYGAEIGYDLKAGEDERPGPPEREGPAGKHRPQDPPAPSPPRLEEVQRRLEEVFGAAVPVKNEVEPTD